MASIDFGYRQGNTGPGVFARLRHFCGDALRAGQYARMLRALSELTDERLDMIGLKRSDIPKHAWHCVYADREA